MEDALDQIDKLQSTIYTKLQENEQKMPEDFSTLEKLSQNLTKYVEKSAKVTQKAKEVLVKIESKVKPDESKFVEWGPEDVCRSVEKF